MTIESLYFNGFRHGRPPKIQRLSMAEINDPSVPLRLMLGNLFGCSGHRLISNEKIGVRKADVCWTWYWPRGTGDWWFIPDKLHEQMKIDEKKPWLALEIKKQLEGMGFPASITDSRLASIALQAQGKEDPLPQKLRDRVNALVARRKFCDEYERAVLDWLVVELVWPFYRS